MYTWCRSSGAATAGVRRRDFSAALAAALAFDFLFIPPFYTFAIGSLEGWLVLAIFLAVAMLLVGRFQASLSNAREAVFKYELSDALASRLTWDAVAETVAGYIAQLFQASRVNVTYQATRESTRIVVSEPKDGKAEGRPDRLLPILNDWGLVGEIQIWRGDYSELPPAEGLAPAEFCNADRQGVRARQSGRGQAGVQRRTQKHVSRIEAEMLKQLRPAFVSLLLLTLITGVVYPLVVTGIAQVVFPRQANGSLIMQDGQAVGSELIGQSFDDPKYFWGRLSATGAFPYNAFNAETLTGSSGSNYGPLNPALVDAAQARIDALKAADPSNTAPIPVDLVTASGSGLDPHISVAAALLPGSPCGASPRAQDADVQELVDQNTQGRQFGFLGEPTVNVLRLNLALDQIQ